MQACIHLLSSSGMVHHRRRSGDECGLVAIEIGGVLGLLVCMTQSDGLSACFQMVTTSS